uniref:Uncharacterized protein n=1 Tax=Lepeophtheirus salmonis TaxID=72036 RepID=A0A0K2V275_LEPSM
MYNLRYNGQLLPEAGTWTLDLRIQLNLSQYFEEYLTIKDSRLDLDSITKSCYSTWTPKLTYYGLKKNLITTDHMLLV